MVWPRSLPTNIIDLLSRYDEVLIYAPNWKQLQEARPAVLPAKS
jgi:hypothetical protein